KTYAGSGLHQVRGRGLPRSSGFGRQRVVDLVREGHLPGRLLARLARRSAQGSGEANLRRLEGQRSGEIVAAGEAVPAGGDERRRFWSTAGCCRTFRLTSSTEPTANRRVGRRSASSSRPARTRFAASSSKRKARWSSPKRWLEQWRVFTIRCTSRILRS